jgi:alpha-L-fucosidase 2
MEWDKDYIERDPHHHHLSHLFGLYPDFQISPDKTPELAEACKKTLERRAINPETGKVVGFYGWNGAWRSACYSRLGYGNEALDALYTMLRTPGAISNTFLSRYPVFQIEGSFGAAAAVAEMLLRSDEERIFLLPALPDRIKDGSYSGLCARGGFSIDAQWKDGKLTNATILSKAGNKCKIKADGLISVDTEYIAVDGFIEFNTEAGKTYNLKF